MPPGKTLEPAQIDALVEWIKMGAPDPRTEAVSAPASSYDWDKARKHWAFQPVGDPQPPRIASAEWNQSPIDAFIKAKLDEKKLTPQPRASQADADPPRDLRPDRICLPHRNRSTPS